MPGFDARRAVARLDRLAAFGAVILVGLLTEGFMWFGCAPAQAKTASLVPVADSLYMVRGGGGNTAVLVTGTGVVLVDSKLAGWGPTLMRQIRSVTDRPVTTIINTHTHGDHVGSNEFFSTVVDVVAQSRTAAHMREMGVFAGDRARFLPSQTFTDRLSLTVGGAPIELYYFGAAHTDGDAVVVFPALGVAHAGDLFAGKSLPTIDAIHGGSGVGYPETLARAYDGIRGVEMIITGHSTLMQWEDLAEYRDFNREFLDWARQQFAAGRSEEDAAAAYRVPKRYSGYPQQPWVARANLETIYRELRGPSTARRWWTGVR